MDFLEDLKPFEPVEAVAGDVEAALNPGPLAAEQILALPGAAAVPIGQPVQNLIRRRLVLPRLPAFSEVIKFTLQAIGIGVGVGTYYVYNIHWEYTRPFLENVVSLVKFTVREPKQAIEIPVRFARGLIVGPYEETEQQKRSSTAELYWLYLSSLTGQVNFIPLSPLSSNSSSYSYRGPSPDRFASSSSSASNPYPYTHSFFSQASRKNKYQAWN